MPARVLAAAAAVLLSACSAAPPATPLNMYVTPSPGASTAASATTVPAATASPAPSSVASPNESLPAGAPPPPAALPPAAGSPAAGAPPLPHMQHADIALEALLPSAVSGVHLTKGSVTPDEFVTAEGEAQFATLLATVGRSREDVTLARASDLTNSIVGRVSALKVSGAESGALLSALLAHPAYAAAAISQVSFGAKDVTVVTLEGNVAEYYVHDDVAFFVTGSDGDTAALFMDAIP